MRDTVDSKAGNGDGNLQRDGTNPSEEMGKSRRGLDIKDRDEDHEPEECGSYNVYL